MLVVSVCANSLLEAPAWFEHADWDSVHPVDVIFPIFVTLSGCGLAFAMHRRVKPMPLLRRAAVLVIVGLLYNAIVLNTWSFDHWRLTGVLQLYAAVVVVLGFLHLVTRTWIGWAVITGTIAAAHTILLALSAVNCPEKLLTRACNPAGPLDVAVFGASHVYGLGAVGHDPEGIVAILGALVSASAGATIGHLLLRRRSLTESAGSRTRTTILSVVGLAVAFWASSELSVLLPHWIWGVDIPAMKRLWTAPFSLRVAAVTAVALLVGHLLLDRKSVSTRLNAASFPLLALGRNSLLVYFGSHVLMSLLTRHSGTGSNAATDIAQAISIGGHTQATWTAVLLAFWVLVAAVLHRFRIYIRP